ncbi:MAG: hypothetical protein J1E85_00060 [Ruminococcus sp.]|nr:hypothetical protein [Ruminococcus sp.]
MSMSIEETAATMNVFEDMKQKAKSALSTAREISMLINSIKSKDNSTDAAQVANKQYQWTGQHTDIAHCATEKITVNDLNKIQDADLQHNVKASFYDAVYDGYLMVNNNGQFILTEKGYQHIQNDSFITQFEKDQYYKSTQNIYSVSLRGNQQDLDIFRYTDKLNFNQIMTDDPNTYLRIMHYFSECKKYGMVNISDNGDITPTDKCKQFLSQNKATANVTNVTADNVASYADFYKSSRNVTNSGKAVASANAAKVGTKAASTATGAATGGATVAAEAIIEISKLGAKQLDKATDLNLTRSSTSKYSH